MERLKNLSKKMIHTIWNGRNRLSIFILFFPWILLLTYFIHGFQTEPYFGIAAGWIIAFFVAYGLPVMLPAYVIAFLLENWLKKLRIHHIIADSFFWALCYSFILITVLTLLLFLVWMTIELLFLN